MTGRLLIIAGIAVLGFAWAGPLPRLVAGSFAAHMWLHMSVVGIGVPLVAIGLAAQRRLHVSAGLVLPIAVSILDLVVVWIWHTPFLHHASRSEPLMLALEQASFAGVAFLVWIVAFGGPPLAGALTLFFTSMHMTLLGALVGLAGRPIYEGHHHDGLFGLDAVADQQLGGVIMLAVGGIIYLGGGLVLAARALRPAVRT
jgi:putative membrane protein